MGTTGDKFSVLSPEVPGLDALPVKLGDAPYLPRLLLDLGDPIEVGDITFVLMKHCSSCCYYLEQEL